MSDRNKHDENTIKNLEQNVTNLSKTIRQLRASLASETAHREQLEQALYDNRRLYQNERAQRIEFERMQMNLKKREVNRDLDILKDIRERDRKLEEIAKDLDAERKRMDILAKALPSEAALGNVDLANMGELAWLFDPPKEESKQEGRRHRKGKRGQ